MVYDIIIVGGGPAGLTSAIYGLRAGKKVLVIERFMPGGQVALTKEIKNYPGYESIDGFVLATNMFNQATSLGMELITSDVLDYEFNGEIKKVKTYEGTFEGKTVILCLGASAKELELENEKRFLGRGVSYCATCDGNFFKDKTVAVVGGGNTAFEDVIYLSNLAKKVYLIHRRDAFRGDYASLEKLNTLAKDNSKLEYVLNSTIVNLCGTEKLESIKVENKLTKEIQTLDVEGVFVAIGRKPDTDLVKDKISLDDKGYIITDADMKTNIDGVYAAGDVRQKTLRQIVTACSDGAIAVLSALTYLQK